MSEIIKTMLLGALGGFAGGWFQSWLRRDEERLKLHREKLEMLLSDVIEWKNVTVYWWQNIRIDSGDYLHKPNRSQMEVLIRVYASNLWGQYFECRNFWDNLERHAIRGDEGEINLCCNNFLLKADPLMNAIVEEIKKYIPQSFSDKYKRKLLGKWKVRDRDS